MQIFALVSRALCGLFSRTVVEGHMRIIVPLPRALCGPFGYDHYIQAQVVQDDYTE